jgi:ketosteroid isomerase-like protein
MTDEEKKQIVRGTFDAYNRHDEKAYVALAADDYKATDIPSGETLRGKDGARVLSPLERLIPGRQDDDPR